jgi:hypothetical protein
VRSWHDEQINYKGDAEADEPRVLIQAVQSGNHKANQRDDNSRRQCRYGAPVETASEFVFTSTLEQLFRIQLALSHHVIIRNHYASDWAKKTRVADEPAHHVRAVARKPAPWLHQKSDKTRDDPSYFEADPARI